MELARRYYEEAVRPAFASEAADDIGSIAFGLVGPGSECYGFDDAISRDHDWGPRVCAWVPDRLFKDRGVALQSVYEGIGDRFLGFGPIRRLDTRVRREGVISILQFYGTHLGLDHPPNQVREWLLLPEEALSTCTNGEVFVDPVGEFSRFRAALRSYYPRDLWLKKIASRCKAAGQHGQYNLIRAAHRGDMLARLHHGSQFMVETARLVYLLQRTFRPFSKWLFRGLLELGDLGNRIHEDLLALRPFVADRESGPVMDRCVMHLVDEIVARGLAEREGDFLYDYGAQIERAIEDRGLRDGLDTIE